MDPSSQLVRDLDKWGLQSGDVVAAIGDNSPAIWPLLHATEALGLVLAIFNEAWSTPYINQLIENLGPQIIVGYGARRPHNGASNLAELWVTEALQLEPCAVQTQQVRRAKVPHQLPGDVDGALVFCTSGSTGGPKCVVSTPRNRDFSALTIGRYLGILEGQRIINALSPSFDYGFYQGLLAKRSGLGLELVRSAQLTGELLQRIRATERGVLPLTPALAARLCGALRPEDSFPGIEIVTLTGGAVSAGLRQRLASAFPQARLFAMYGLTECKRVAYLDPEQFLQRPYSCGREMAGVTAVIVDPDGKPFENGFTGELTIQGDNVCLGYWGDPPANARRFRKNAEGKVTLFTGDRFRRDKDGFLEFISRNDEQVKLRDERVNLGTIERELRASSLVLDLSLRIDQDDLGIPTLIARVVPEGPWVTERDVLRSFHRCVSRSGHIPHQIVLVQELPITEHGKHVTAAALNPAV
jgi:long-chain acyl-CoA synthetase